MCPRSRHSQPSAPREVPPAAYSVGPGPGWTQSGAPYAPQGSAIQWDLAWKGALLAGVGAAILTAIPFVSIGCCLWMLGAGVLSVAMYRKQVPGTLVTPGMGMKLGALAGVFGFMVNAVVTVLSFALFRSNSDFRRAMQEQMEKQMANNPDPKAQAIVQHFMDWMSSPQGAATFVVLICCAGSGVHRNHRCRRRAGSFDVGQQAGIAMIGSSRFRYRRSLSG